MTTSAGSVICLSGPTAAGKTAAALAIAQHHDVEIISMDSALVYCGMDVGTAKPSVEELACVKHHLINIRDPLQAYSAAEFVHDASKLIDDITSRGKRVLLVGGTLLYFKALADGLGDMPKADAAVRAAIASQALASGWPALHAQLALVDAITAERLQPNDSQRISRALEVYQISGQPLSFFHQQDAIEKLAARAHKLGAADLISLEPNNRSWLHERIAQRFDAMLSGGFLAEVEALHARGDLHADLPAMRCVGYRQALSVVRGLSPMSELRDKGIFATRQLAKRQITWLRSMPSRHVVPCDAPDANANANVISNVLKIVNTRWS